MLGDEYRPVWWEGTEEYAVNPGKVRFRIIPSEPPKHPPTLPFLQRRSGFFSWAAVEEVGKAVVELEVVTWSTRRSR